VKPASKVTYRVLDTFPEPDYTVLVDEAFSEYEESQLLSEVAREELAARSDAPDTANDRALRIGAFRGDKLVGWTYARPEGSSILYMINSGVAQDERRIGIYSQLVQLVIEHARSQGYPFIWSRHASNNNAVIVAKLKLGFFVSGFEYSEVYGPLVRLTYLPGEKRRMLQHERSKPIRRARPENDA
jgi:GNAT superfamily N-acetyltransferase